MSDSPSSDPNLEKPGEQPPEPIIGGDAASTEEEYIQLNSRQLQSEIKRLESENEEFRRIFNSEIGTRAARKYRPQLEDRDRQIEMLNREIRKRDIQAMTPEDIEKKFRTDPDFAREYTEIVHTRSEPSVVDDTPHIQAAWENAIDWAKSNGVPESVITDVTQKAISGQYAEEGEHWSLAMQRVQSDFAKHSNGTESKPKTNPELQKKGPDLTNNSRGATSVKVPGTVAEFNALPKAQKEQIMSTPEGVDAVQKLAAKR